MIFIHSLTTTIFLVSATLKKESNLMASEFRLQPGTRVSNWTITRSLGAGAFGAVFLCENNRGTKAALKTEPTNAAVPLLAMEVI